MAQQDSKRHISIAVTSFVLSLLTFAFYLSPSRGGVIQFISAQLIIGIFCAYCFSRTINFTDIDQNATSNLALEPIACVSVMLAPILLADVADLCRLVLLTPNNEAPQLVIGVAAMIALLIVFVLIYVSAMLPVSDKSVAIEYMGLPISIISLIIVVGSNSWLGFLTVFIPLSLFDINFALRVVVIVMVLAAVAVEALAHLRSKGTRFAHILARYRISLADDGAKARTYTARGPSQAFLVLLLFASVFFKFLAFVIVTFFAILFTLGEGVVAAFASLLNVERLAISGVLSIAVVVGLLIQHNAILLGGFIAAGITGFGFDTEFLVFGVGYVLGLLVMAAGYVWLCYRRLGGVVSAYAFVMALMSGGVWLSSLVLHSASMLGLVDAPGYGPLVVTPFFTGGVVFLLVGGVITWLRGGIDLAFDDAVATDLEPPVDSQNPSDRKPGPTTSTRYWPLGAALTIILAFGVFLFFANDGGTRDPSEVSSPLRDSRSGSIEASPGTSPTEAYRWSEGRWGDPSCANVIEVQVLPDLLRIRFAGETQDEHIVDSTRETVATRQWTFARHDDAISVTYRGQSLGELTSCR